MTNASHLEPPSLRAGASANWSLLLLTLLMGGALVSTTWFGVAAAEEASHSLARSEGYDAVRPLNRQAREQGARPLPAAILAQHIGADEDEGPEVFYLATLDPLTGELREAGESRLGAERVRAELRQGRDSGFTLLEGGVALMIRRLPPGADARARYPQGLVPTAELGLVAVEFSPDAALRLQSAASRALAAGGTATILLLLTSITISRLQTKRALLERRLSDERSLTALGEMSAVLAHEIRNPLASLKGHAQLLAESLEDDKAARTKAERVVGEALRLELLSGQLLEFVRSAAVEPVPTTLASFLEGCVSAVPEARVELSLTASPQSWPLDPMRLQQVLVNLLRNASQAAPDGLVRVCAEERGGALVITVRDAGPGLPPGQETEIFRPFFTTRARGTGLGLAVARRAIELHGGTLEAQNQPEGGAEFKIRLPKTPRGGGR